MTTRGHLILLLVVGAVVAPRAHADAQAGAFAIRGGSARSAVLGEAYGAMGGDADALLWNPAALLFVTTPHLQATYHDVYGLGLAHHSTATLAWRRGRETVSVHGDSIRVTVERDAGAAFAVGLEVTAVDLDDENYFEYAPTVAAAFPIASGSGVGVAVRYLRAATEIDDVRATGYALDVGVVRSFGAWGRIGGSIRNLLGRLSWNHDREEDQPREFAGSVAVRPVERIWLAGAVGDDLDEDGLDRVQLATEVEALPGRLWFQVGGASRRTGDDRLVDLAIGARVQVHPVAVDYAFVPEQDLPGDTHRMTLTILF